MNVRKALWIAGLGSVFAWPMLAMAQTVTESPAATETPALLQGSPTEPGVAPADIAPSKLRRFFTPGDPLAQQRFWFTSEALLMWTKSLNIPPLVTTGPIDVIGTGGTVGTMGNSGTMTLVDRSVGFGPSGGGRFTFGGWVLPEVPLGLEVSYLFLGTATGSRHLSENGLPGSQALSFPFFDAANNVESSASIALPTTPGFGGTVDIRTTSRLQGWEVTAGTDFGNFGRVHVIGLGGYRYLGLNESFRLSTTRMNTDPTVGEVFRTTDDFSTSNAFHGGQLGLRAECGAGPVSFNATGKVALGDIRQKTNISGSVVTNDFNGFGTPQTFNSGLLATGTNSGSFGRDRIAVVPELQLGANWQPTSWVRLSFGYQFLYLSSVSRPTDQIDRSINTSQSPAFLLDQSQTLVGPARPFLLPVAHSDFWAQGLTAGMEFKF
jgi:Putative beta barrel porin-7 (BBP7)